MKIGDRHDAVQWLNVERDDPEAFGQTLAGKLQDFTGTAIGPGCNLHYNNVAIAYTHLYGFDMEGVGANANAVTRSGNQGNIAELRIPESASLLRKAYNVVVGPELAWSAVATTTDYASMSQAITARNALEYCWRHEGFGATAKSVQWDAMSLAEGAMHIPWDPTLGNIVSIDQSDPENPRPIMSGWFAYRPVMTWDIIRDPTAKSFDSIPWRIIREWPNKFDVAASVNTGDPERDETVRNAVLSSGASPPLGQAWMPFKWAAWNLSSDLIPLYYLYCKRTPSVPAGRQTVFLEDGTVISDGPLDERYVNGDGSCVLPVVRTASGGYRGTPWPYTKYFGILGAEQANDGLTRDLLTNATATSGNVLDVPEKMMDAGASVAFQTGGPQMIARPEGVTQDIKVLQLQQSHPEHFKLGGTLGNKMQSIMGIDQLTAGNEIGASWSGALAALVTSTTVQNNSAEQSEFTAFVQACGNVTLKHIQHMPTKMRIALAGNARQSLVTTTEIAGTDVEGIERVIATIGSALEQTDAGKNEIAGTALKEGWVKTPEDYQTVRDTGRLDGLNEGLSNQLLLIRSENERLARGEECIVVLTDDHRLHIKKHPEVTASVEAREKPEVNEATQAHIDWHIRVLRETDPAILSAMGQEPLAPAGPPSGTPPPMPGATSATKPPQEQQQAQAPSMPTNPQTGEKVQQAAGVTPPAMAIKPN